MAQEEGQKEYQRDWSRETSGSAIFASAFTALQWWVHPFPDQGLPWAVQAPGEYICETLSVKQFDIKIFYSIMAHVCEDLY